jgi:formamidopyrimidine-DNA glycosylase
MPEGPEVHIYSEILNKLTKGNILESVELSNGKKIKLNLKVIKVDCKGKLLFFILETDKVIFITFGLTGDISLIKSKNTRSILKFNSLNKIKLKNSKINLTIDKGIKHTPINFINEILQNLGFKFRFEGNKDTIYYIDPLNFGKIIIGDTKLLNKKKKALGVDPLENRLTKKQFDDIINSISLKIRKRSGSITLYEFLMKQNYLCGIGNYLSQEIMYHSGLSPHRKLNEFEQKEKNKLYRIIIKIMKWSYISQGGSFNLYNNMNVPKVPLKLMIYGKNECKKGKIKIDKIIKGRTVRWCPEIQN